MKYVQPVGEADPNASYKDRNTGAGIPGSRVPALAIENPQREIEEVIRQAGLTPSSENAAQLYEAIQILIGLITGEGENPLNDLLTLLRSKMLVYPEILTSDGKIPCLSPSTGNFRVPLGYTFRHRGVFDVTTVQSDFATSANKTYHCFWDPTNGVQFEDLADLDYNPGTVAETSAIFDSGYDRMLICRVVTDASNVLTITNIVNRDRLTFSAAMTATDLTNSGAGEARCTQTALWNFARTPKNKSLTRTYLPINEAFSDHDELLYAAFPGTQIYEVPATRYGSSFICVVDGMNGLARYEISVSA